MDLFFNYGWAVPAALWFFINGVLHDVFVVKNHKGPYNRELLRLLMDGHLLIISGLMMGISYFLLKENNIYGAILSLITSISMIVYCAMIYPFLKSIVTLLISVCILILSLKILF